MSQGGEGTVTELLRDHAIKTSDEKAQLQVVPANDEAQLEEDVKAAFEEINQLRLAIEQETAPIREEIAALQAQASDIIAPHAARIDDLREWIKNQVLGNEQSIKTPAGACTYVKGRKPTPKWDDAALNGYAAAGHEELLQFRQDGKPGKPGVRWTEKPIEDLIQEAQE